jgi:ABC-type polysaccharide/polyol phosphate export permease
MTVPRAGETYSSSQVRSESAWAQVWRFRELLISLVIRDIKVKYQRSFLGLVWTLMNPLLTLAVLITVFSYVIRIPVSHYWAFLISGYFVWNFFQQSLHLATSILRDHASLNRSVYFPREILILGAAISKLVEFLVEISIVGVALIVFHHHALPSSTILLPVVILLQFVMGVAIMFPLAVVAVMFYDVQQALPIVIMSLFYLSPVFYPVAMVPESIWLFYYLNPLAGILELFHAILYEGVWPSMALMVWVAVGCTGFLAIGYGVFNRFKEICVEIA